MPELDGVRGAAVLAVLVFHYLTMQVAERADGSWLAVARRAGRWGWSGVDLFFVLSGFLIAGILLDHRRASNLFAVFYARRTTRILPLYLAVVAGYFLCLAAGLDLRPRFGAVFEHALPAWRYLTFTQNLRLGRPDNLGAEFLAPTWSLAVEEQFYLLLPAIASVLTRRRLAVLAAALISVSFLARAAEPEARFFFSTIFKLDGLSCGVLAAIALREPGFVELFEKRRVAFRLATLALLGLVAFGSWSAWQGAWVGTLLALAYTSLVLTAALDRGSAFTFPLRLRPLVFLGEISFALYLFHEPVVGLLHGAYDGSRPSWDKPGGAWVTLVALVASVGLARLSWHYYERPFLAIGKRFRYREPDSGTPANVTAD